MHLQLYAAPFEEVYDLYNLAGSLMTDALMYLPVIVVTNIVVSIHAYILVAFYSWKTKYSYKNFQIGRLQSIL